MLKIKKFLLNAIYLFLIRGERYSSLLKVLELKEEEQVQRKRKILEDGGESKPKRRRQSKEASNTEESASVSPEPELAPVEEEKTPSETSTDQTESTASIASAEENHQEELMQKDLELKRIEKEKQMLEMKIEVCESCGLREGCLLACTKCRTFYHPHCLRGKIEGEPQEMPEEVKADNFLCLNCDPSSVPSCCLCKQPGGLLTKCNQTKICSRRFHQDCLKGFHSLSVKRERPASQFTCPAHYCHTCTAELNELQKPDKSKLVHCIACPTAYHSSTYSIPSLKY